MPGIRTGPNGVREVERLDHASDRRIHSPVEDGAHPSPVDRTARRPPDRPLTAILDQHRQIESGRQLVNRRLHVLVPVGFGPVRRILGHSSILPSATVEGQPTIVRISAEASTGPAA